MIGLRSGRSARNEGLQHRPHARVGRVAIPALLDGPYTWCHADGHRGPGRDPFLRDEEVKLPLALRCESGDQSFPSNDVLEQVDVAVEREAERGGARLSSA
jgi:hypothetical protein